MPNLNREFRRTTTAIGLDPSELSEEESRAVEDAVIERVRVRILPDGRMDRNNAAAYLGHSTKTLAMWAVANKGPRYVLVGGRAFYFKADLDRFIGG